MVNRFSSGISNINLLSRITSGYFQGRKYSNLNFLSHHRSKRQDLCIFTLQRLHSDTKVHRILKLKQNQTLSSPFFLKNTEIMVQKLTGQSHRDGRFIKTSGLEVNSLKSFFTLAETNLNLKWLLSTFDSPNATYLWSQIV